MPKVIEPNNDINKLIPHLGSDRYTDNNGEDYLMIPLKDIINVEFDHRLSTDAHSTITLTYIVR